ncbi:MAG: aldehyde dehydrogenase family protein, partial [Calditrichaeota bacterium]
MAKMFISGEWVDAASGEVDEIRNPATGELVDTIPRGTREDARRAIDAAEAAFPGWAEVPFSRRGELLFKAAALIRANEKELAKTLTLEQGKPIRESVREIRRFAHTIEHYAGLGKNVRGGYVPLLDKGKYGRIIKKPIGVCGAIVPWNFPVALMGNKIGPGLLAGNT